MAVWIPGEELRLLTRLRTYASFVRISHSVFALPFALTGALLASQQVPLTWDRVAWVVVGPRAQPGNRIPTAGLEPGQSDYKDLGYDYDVVELVSEGFVQGLTAADLSRHPQIAPVVETQLAHYKDVFGAAKFTSADQVVADVLRRHEIAKGKMKIVHPPSPTISLTYD